LPDVQGSAAKPSARPPPSSIVLVIGGAVAEDQIVALCRRIGGLLERSESDLIFCDVGALDDPDAATVDLVARLQLTARRLGRQVRLLDACGELQDLIELTGLSEIFSVSDELDLEPSGDPEQGEPSGRVEEKRDPGDGIA
jgi:ABC-type transporter Mla MlaB component